MTVKFAFSSVYYLFLIQNTQHKQNISLISASLSTKRWPNVMVNSRTNLKKRISTFFSDLFFVISNNPFIFRFESPKDLIY